MTLTEILDEEEKKAHPKPQLRVITGGKGPPTDNSNSEDWLINLQKGAVFSCKRRNTTVELDVYGVSFKHPKTVVLFNALGTTPPRAVDTREFCKQYILFEIIDEGGKEPLEVENDGIRSIRPLSMEDNADAEGR